MTSFYYFTCLPRREHISTLPEGKTLTGYSSLKDLQDNGNLTDVTEKFEKSGQNESKLQVKAKEQIALGQEKLYIIVNILH